MKFFRIAFVAAALCWLPMSSALAQTQVKCPTVALPVSLSPPVLSNIPEAVKNAVKQFYPAETVVVYQEHPLQSTLPPVLKSAIFASTTAATGKVYVVTKFPQYGPTTTVEYATLSEAAKTFFKKQPQGSMGGYDPATNTSIKPCIRVRTVTNSTKPMTEVWLSAQDNMPGIPFMDGVVMPDPSSGLFLGLFDHTGRIMPVKR